MPVATDTLKLSTPVPPPAMGRLRTPSHRDFTSGETPLPSLPATNAMGPVRSVSYTHLREDGADALASYLAANEAQGLLYHRDTVHFTGDYDISEDEAEILRLLREGSKP